MTKKKATAKKVTGSAKGECWVGIRRYQLGNEDPDFDTASPYRAITEARVLALSTRKFDQTNPIVRIARVRFAEVA